MPHYMELGARVSERWSPGRCVMVDMREPPATTEDPMTEDRMALVELLQKSGDGDFLRAVAEAVLQILMEADVEELIGAGRHERSADPLNYRNGYRDRCLDTRLGPLSLRIPKLRQGSYFPPFLEPRKTAEKALVTVIQEAWIGGVSTRRVDEWVQATGLSGISKRSPELPASAGRNSFDFGAGVGVDFEPDGNLDDDRRLPLHGHFLRSGTCLLQTEKAAEPWQLELPA